MLSFLLVALASTIAQADERMTFVDLQPKASRKLLEDLGGGLEGNSLEALPQGKQTLGGVPFTVGPGLLHLGSTLVPELPERIDGVAIGRRFKKLHLLHATCYGGGPNIETSPGHVKDQTIIGQYTLYYDDGTSQSIPIVYGEDVRDWWYREGEAPPSKSKVVWTGGNERSKSYEAAVRLYLNTWENPAPHKRVTSLNYIAYKSDTPAAPFCVAITAEE